MDDSQDKVRRNLVVVAATIILIQYLQVQITPEAVAMGIFKLTKMPELRFWFLALIVLGYLFQRYWFDDVTKAHISHAWEEFVSLRGSQIKKKLTQQVRRYLEEGRPPKSFYDLSKLQSEFQSQNHPPNSFDRLHINIAPQAGELRLKALHSLVEVSHMKGQQKVSSVSSEWDTAYELSIGDTLAVLVVPVLRVGLVSKSAVDFFVPIYLTVSAVGICIFHIWKAIASP